MASYANIIKPTNPLTAKGGYKNKFFFAPTGDFLAIQKPVLTTPTALLGEAKTIATAHTFTSPKGFFSWELKTNSVTATSATVGDDGEKLPEYSYEFTVLGDNATTQEQMETLLNSGDIICLFKDSNCLENDSYIQLGDECNSPYFDVAFDGRTPKEGMKQWKVTAKCNVRYFYTGTVTLAS